MAQILFWCKLLNIIKINLITFLSYNINIIPISSSILVGFVVIMIKTPKYIHSAINPSNDEKGPITQIRKIPNGDI